MLPGLMPSPMLIRPVSGPVISPALTLEGTIKSVRRFPSASADIYIGTQYYVNFSGHSASGCVDFDTVDSRAAAGYGIGSGYSGDPWDILNTSYTNSCTSIALSIDGIGYTGVSAVDTDYTENGTTNFGYSGLDSLTNWALIVFAAGTGYNTQPTGHSNVPVERRISVDGNQNRSIRAYLIAPASSGLPNPVSLRAPNSSSGERYHKAKFDLTVTP